MWFNSWWEIRAPRVTRKDGMPVTRGEEVMLQVNTTRCITRCTYTSDTVSVVLLVQFQFMQWWREWGEENEENGGKRERERESNALNSFVRCSHYCPSTSSLFLLLPPPSSSFIAICCLPSFVLIRHHHYTFPYTFPYRAWGGTATSTSGKHRAVGTPLKSTPPLNPPGTHPSHP